MGCIHLIVDEDEAETLIVHRMTMNQSQDYCSKTMKHIFHKREVNLQEKSAHISFFEAAECLGAGITTFGPTQSEFANWLPTELT